MGDVLRPDWSGRLAKAAQHGTIPPGAAFLISTPINIQYLSGFEGSQGLLILSPAGHTLLLDGRYEAAARESQLAGGIGPVEIRGFPGRLVDALATIVAGLPSGEVAFEAERVTVATLEDWRQACPGRAFVATRGVVEAIRMVKEPGELSTIRAACAKLSGIARQLGDWVAEGRTERAIATDIEAAIVRAGFSRPAFPTIVASGPNSAHPHARPSDRMLQRGDLVVLDFGGVLDGYCGDLTRMAAVGPVQANARALVDAVRAAQDAALASVRAGCFASDVDKAARDVLSIRGLGEAFLHATGHGLGLELHESPRIGRRDADRAAPDVILGAGMVCTIEPGAYLDGFGGARLEDDVVVTAEGCELLTDAPRELLIV